MRVCVYVRDALACVWVCVDLTPPGNVSSDLSLFMRFPLLNSEPREHAGGYARTEELDKHFYLFTVRNYQSELNINTAKGREC